MQDKRRLLTSREIGRDEASTQSLQKKLDALHLEIEAFKANMERLNKMAQSLVERQHYDASNVEIKQVSKTCIVCLKTGYLEQITILLLYIYIYNHCHYRLIKHRRHFEKYGNTVGLSLGGAFELQGNIFQEKLEYL